LEKPYVVAYALAISLGKPIEWDYGFFFGNLELNLELFNVISGISGMDS
jgi:hypothetical protein